MLIKGAILFFGILMMQSVVIFTCSDCTAVQYQIYEIVPKDNVLCEYRTRAMTDCAIWRNQGKKFFVDSCGKYTMSQYFLKTQLDAKYP